MSEWQDLKAELDAWGAAGRVATLWWRDDDAVEPSAALDRLLDLAEAHGAPIALAIIPARATITLAERLAESGARVTALQHGYAHVNHAPEGEKKVELGGQRAMPAILEDLANGAARMASLFGPRGLPVLAPPWNRFAEVLLGALPGLGIRGLSAYSARGAREPVPGLIQTNTHADILRWTQPRGFLGEAEALDRLIGHLGARRRGEADAEEPTGLLTHHLAHDAAAWTFLARLLPFLTGHPATSLIPAAEAFAISPGKTSGKAP